MKNGEVKWIEAFNATMAFAEVVEFQNKKFFFNAQILKKLTTFNIEKLLRSILAASMGRKISKFHHIKLSLFLNYFSRL